MNRWLLICLLLASCAARAQTVYESFEVDTVCEPQGGQAMLQLFIQSNLSVPVNAQADRVKGRVFVSGVVEPDGKISSLSVTRGLRPDCNREALRVFTLFNAWAPARKDGQPVRQHIIYPVTFTRLPESLVGYVNNGSAAYHLPGHLYARLTSLHAGRQSDRIFHESGRCCGRFGGYRLLPPNHSG